MKYTTLTDRRKNYMTIWIDVDKSFDNVKYIFMIKPLKKLGKKGMYLNIIEDIYGKLITNIRLNSETLKILLRSRTKQGCPLSLVFFNRIFP